MSVSESALRCVCGLFVHLNSYSWLMQKQYRHSNTRRNQDTMMLWMQRICANTRATDHMILNYQIAQHNCAMSHAHVRMCYGCGWCMCLCTVPFNDIKRNADEFPLRKFIFISFLFLCHKTLAMQRILCLRKCNGRKFVAHGCNVTTCHTLHSHFQFV